MMSIFYESNQPFLLFKFVDKDIVSDMNAPPSLHRPAERLSDLRVLTDLPGFFTTCSKRGASFVFIFLNVASTSGSATMVYVIQRWL